jgi:heat shock protein HslJ
MTRSLLVVALLVALLAGCELDRSTTSDVHAGGRVAEFGPPGAGPTGGWLLVDGKGPDGEIPQVEGHRSTLLIDDGDVAGQAACNGFGGGRVHGDRIRFVELVMTLIGCEGEVGASEQAYLAAVQDADTIRRDGERLLLTGPSTTLTFEYLATPDLYHATSGRTMHLKRIRHDGDSTGFVRPATLRLYRGSIEGSTGCRSFSGTYVEREDELVVTGLSVEGDVEECEPREVAQDPVVLEVLGGPVRVRIENGTQLIVTAQGGDSLEYGPGR